MAMSAVWVARQVMGRIPIFNAAPRSWSNPAVPVPGAIPSGYGRVSDRTAGKGRRAHRRRGRLRRADRRARRVGGGIQPAGRPGVHPADWIRLNGLAAARGQVLTPPKFAWHERAWLLIEAGDRDAAAALVASVPISPAAYRWRHTAMLTSDAELAAAVSDRRRCTALYEQLLPSADEFAVVGAAVFTTGPVALQLGLLAALGRWDDAARHLGHAVTRCDRLGARLYGDRARAELERLPTARVRVGGRSEPSEFRRDGEVWTLTFAGRRAQLRDVKGLRDLAVLLAAPGQEVAAADLVTGMAQPGHAFGAAPVLDERARAEYRARLGELDDELAQADAHHDVERSARLAAERDARKP
jgi:hypothetical protein